MCGRCTQSRVFFFFFSSRRRHTRFDCDWSSDVCSSDLVLGTEHVFRLLPPAVAVDSRRGRVRARGLAVRGIARMKLLAFLMVAMVVHGPLSPLLPTAFETALLYYVRFYPAWLLAVVGTLGASLAEALNYRLVDWAVELPKLAALKQRSGVRWTVGAFLRAPFWTTA